MSDYVNPEPPPVESDGDTVWGSIIADLAPMAADPVGALLLADMRARDAMGRERYGMPLQPFNGRDALVDAYQEALDLVAYARQARMEAGADAASNLDDLVEMPAMKLAASIRFLLAERDGGSDG